MRDPVWTASMTSPGAARHARSGTTASSRSSPGRCSAGVDRVTYEDYEKRARQNIQELHGRLKSKTYRALPLRRIYIPKEDGKQRPISIPALEDKILQKATVKLLTAVYEQDFLDCSYGFRPGRGAQEALDEVG
jgi:RNA-directed DNA polymerase